LPVSITPLRSICIHRPDALYSQQVTESLNNISTQKKVRDEFKRQVVDTIKVGTVSAERPSINFPRKTLYRGIT
jgi:hypothetical protein